MGVPWTDSQMTIDLLCIRHPWGYGPAHPESHRAQLQSWCDAMNERYGRRSHFIVPARWRATDADAVTTA